MNNEAERGSVQHHLGERAEPIMLVRA